MEFKENLRYLRYQNNMSQNKLADMMGYKSFTTIQKWEDGTSFPPVRQLGQLAKIFNIDVNHLLYINIRNENVEVPILGEVKAGYDAYANEDILGFEYLAKKDYEPGEYFYLKVKGDSMINERIAPGDILYVKKQQYLYDKELGVFLLDNNEVTVKRISYAKNGVILKAANPKYEDRKYKMEDIKILGKVLHNKIVF